MSSDWEMGGKATTRRSRGFAVVKQHAPTGDFIFSVLVSSQPANATIIAVHCKVCDSCTLPAKAEHRNRVVADEIESFSCATTALSNKLSPDTTPGSGANLAPQSSLPR
jgi:hypothetical protein